MRKRLLDEGKSEAQAVKAYSLLRAILTTATKEDGILRQNPCRISYDHYHTPERPTATVDQVLKLAQAMPGRYRALVLVAVDRAAVGGAGGTSTV